MMAVNSPSRNSMETWSSAVTSVSPLPYVFTISTARAVPDIPLHYIGTGTPGLCKVDCKVHCKVDCSAMNIAIYIRCRAVKGLTKSRCSAVKGAMHILFKAWPAPHSCSRYLLSTPPRRPVTTRDKTYGFVAANLRNSQVVRSATLDPVTFCLRPPLERHHQVQAGSNGTHTKPGIPQSAEEQPHSKSPRSRR